MMLDVLIIGGGPHALTLASLLSNPDPDRDLTLSRPCPDPVPHQARLEPCKRKNHPLGPTLEEQLSESPGALCPALRLQVVDSYGQWTGLWESQFSALSIPHLRSHTLVHTDPRNKNALQEFVAKHHRSAELRSLPDRVYIRDENAFFNDTRLGKKEKKRLNVASTLRKSSCFSLPGTRLSVDFFKEQVQRYNLDDVMIKGTVEEIIPVFEDRSEGEGSDGLKETRQSGRAGKRVKYFKVQLHQGVILAARQLVLATGPTRAQMANIPSWVDGIGESYPEERLQHTVHLMHHLVKSKQRHVKVCAAGQRVMVVGGGLTSAHVVSAALQQGAGHVTWLMRKHLQLKQFDVGDVESLVGRYSHVEHGTKMDGRAFLRQFYNQRSLHKRLAMIYQARKGGAVTPEAYIHLRPFIVDGSVDVKTYCQVSEARWCYRSQAWSLSLSTGATWTGDVIWLATGCRLDVQQDSLLSGVMKEFPLQVIDGWPCISETLQWADGCPLYVMGQYAALQIGPHAVNLAGGQAASLRIAKDIMRRQRQDSAEGSVLNGEKCKAEEYVQQMQGLFWL